MDEDGALAFPEGFGCDPRADLHRMPRIRGVEDPKAGARRVAGELRERDRRVHVGAAADCLQPDLVRSAGIGADERELLRRARVGDVVEPEAAVRVRARAILEADGGELAVAACWTIVFSVQVPRTARFAAPSANVETCRGRLGLLRL